MTLKLSFFGAAQNVTGSSYFLDDGGVRLLVDCGLYQERALKQRNWDPFPVPPAGVDCVLLTHAHVDHCGLLPKFVHDGFKGAIHCTPATADIARIVLLDAAKVQEEDAAFKRMRHEREGRPGPFPEIPLYTAGDVEATLPLLATVPYGESLRLSDALTASFLDAGHILGSAMIRLRAGSNGGGRTLLFSGDVGRWNAPLLRDPTLFDEADYVVVESTYGNRDHKPEDSIPAALAGIVNAAVEMGGNVVIPSFAVERAQELLFHLNALLRQGRIPPVPVFVDSPMAIRVTEVFRRHPELMDDDTVALLRQGGHPCDFPGLTLCRGVEESKAIRDRPGTAVIIAGSGMCTAGRIKHHLVNNISDPRSTVLFVGYQAQGTLGRLILEGAAEVRILGQTHPVRARVARINGFSGHAGRGELLRWLRALRRPPRHVFVTHGEPANAESFAALVRTETGWPVSVPRYGETAALD
jgi:metallo-beta-lactamase family protein